MAQTVGQSSLTGAPFELGEEICHTNSGTADTMGAIFRSVEPMPPSQIAVLSTQS